MSSNPFTMPPQNPPPYSPSREPEPNQRREDWEDWDDDDDTIVTPIDASEQIMIEPPPPTTVPRRVSKPSGSRASRVSIAKVKRLRSRHRQKAQNAKAGIKVITDMSTFRRQNHIANQLRTPDGRPVKFVDAAALRALEGEPSSASVGGWNWLKRTKTQSPASAVSTSPPQQVRPSSEQGLSPEDRPIVIGIAFASDEYSSREISPQTATIDTPMPLSNAHRARQNHPAQVTANAGSTPVVQQTSVWSPDTPDTACSFGSVRATSSIYSQATAIPITIQGDVPPVPALPSNYRKTTQQRLVSMELGNTGDDDSGTPCTLFEEDGIPSPEKQKAKGKLSAITPDSANSRSHGWWDHVITPFTDKRFTLASRKQKLESMTPKEKDEDQWWKSTDTKEVPAIQYLTPKPSPVPSQTPIVRAPTPRRTPSPRAQVHAVTTSGPSTARSSPAPEQQQQMSEKSQTYFANDTAVDHPPPYSPAKQEAAAPVKYRPVFPPGHPLQAQFPPSPGPASPGLAATMTSQGATQMTDIPLTPAPRNGTPLAQMSLPNRPLGTFVPQEHSHDARGDFNSVERKRRRHEKEEVVARRFGGFWRGRGCVPKSGCFGRTGREGRRKRRICMAVWGAIIALIILTIVLAVVLTRPHGSHEAPSIWVNLTDFPPMPTGVMTVVGPDNTVSKSSCTEPTTMWSCALPKEQHDSVEPYKPNQPTVIMQIQWDNSTREAWNVPNGDPPTPLSRRSSGAAAFAASFLRKRQTDDGFESQPSPPDFKEMFFLGNTTDDVKSDEKGGEPTPFYISLLNSTDDETTLKRLARRQEDGVNLTGALPDPDLNEDGTPKPAVLLPKPVQQPVRLYDRGLPTEHYGFYTYFKRTIFLKSVTVLNDTDEGDIPLDRDGGSRETEADFIATWSETRLLVRIWTRTLEANTSTLLETGESIDGSEELIRPGTMPYPVTVTLDTHGGDPAKKFVWAWPLDDRQQVDTDQVKLLANDIGAGGTWVNKRSRGDAKFGGFDGGTGGCKCEWVNWIQTRKSNA